MTGEAFEGTGRSETTWKRQKRPSLGRLPEPRTERLDEEDLQCEERKGNPIGPKEFISWQRRRSTNPHPWLSPREGSWEQLHCLSQTATTAKAAKVVYWAQAGLVHFPGNETKYFWMTDYKSLWFFILDLDNGSISKLLTLSQPGVLMLIKMQIHCYLGLIGPKFKDFCCCFY